MKKNPIFLAMLVALLALSFTFIGCSDDDGGGGGGGGDGGLTGIWSQPDNTAIRFSGSNIQVTGDVTSTNVNWTAVGTFTYSSPTLTITPIPVGGVVQNAVQGVAVISGIQLAISGFPNNLGINGNWTKQ